MTTEYSESYEATAGLDAGRTMERVRAREEKVRSEFWRKFRRFAGRLPFAEDLLAAYYCALDTETPLKVRATLLGALVYFIVPTDLIPDLVAGLGFTDDAAVLAAAVSLVVKHIRPRHRAAAARTLERALPDGLGTA